jgi:hypothetical protein
MLNNAQNHGKEMNLLDFHDQVVKKHQLQIPSCKPSHVSQVINPYSARSLSGSHAGMSCWAFLAYLGREVTFGEATTVNTNIFLV